MSNLHDAENSLNNFIFNFCSLIHATGKRSIHNLARASNRRIKPSCFPEGNANNIQEFVEQSYFEDR